MNAVEVEEDVSALAERSFAEDFAHGPFEAFGKKATTIKQLNSGTHNSADVVGRFGPKRIIAVGR